jgi:homoserine O-acetyltransferase
MDEKVHEFEYNPRGPVTPGCSFCDIATSVNPFFCELGGKLTEAALAYETWGKLDGNRSNVVWICPSLSMSSHASSSALNRDEGWWETLIGPGKVVDTQRWFVVCSNLLGGCYGSTGPATRNPATGKAYASQFPILTIRDLVHAQKRLMDALEIKRLHAVLGGSMGGMQVLEWGRLYPEAMELLVPIAASAAASPRSIAMRSIQREIVQSAPEWKGGEYYESQKPTRAMMLARKLGMVTYRSYEEFWDRFGRNTSGARFEIENYLEYVSLKFAQSFDANSFLRLSYAMDTHDLGHQMAGKTYSERLNQGICAIAAPMLILSMRNDELFPPLEQKYLHRIRAEVRLPSELVEIPVVTGHDGFLAEAELMIEPISDFLNGGN